MTESATSPANGNSEAFDATAARQRLRLDQGWKFTLGPGQNFPNGPLDDSAWRTVNLPHDWSIEGTIERQHPMGGAGGFFPAGVGWYRRRITAPNELKGKRVLLEFEGVYMNADVWLNGRHAAHHAYGYTGFVADLTEFWLWGQENVICVRADNSQQVNCRWYSGSGIYRHVWLTLCDPRGIEPQGVFVQTPRASAQRASVIVQTQLAGGGDSQNAKLLLRTELLGPDGKQVASSESSAQPGQCVEQTLELSAPRLWSESTPDLHVAVSRLLDGDRILDEVRTHFGVRQLAWSAQQGLEINGQPVKLCGGCLHHDNGPLGAAALDKAEYRRVELLKNAGFNALRTSHNPPSPAFLDACDRLGMLVMDESFDGWAMPKNPHDYHVVFERDALEDTAAMVRRDRNHPSIICWSVGNEMYERFLPAGAVIAAKLAGQVRKLDKSRPVAAALCGFWVAGGDWSDADALFSSLDICGYNYLTDRCASDHPRYPERLIALTETFPIRVFEGWQATADLPYVLGDFVWTAWDYLGEAGIGQSHPEGKPFGNHGTDQQYPWHGACCGDLDICGHRKPWSHYRNIIWQRGQMLHMTVHPPLAEGEKIVTTPWGWPPSVDGWTWPGCAGRPTDVSVYSRWPMVRLLLDDQVIGEKPTGIEQQFAARFTLPYAPGRLTAQGVRDGKVMEQTTLQTVGKPAAIRLTVENQRLRADGQDVAFVKVQITDAAGLPHPLAEDHVEFFLDGPATLAGIASGDMQNTQPYFASARKMYQGRGLAVVRAGTRAGTVQLSASAAGLTGARVTIEIAD